VQAHILVGGEIYRSDPVVINGTNKENEVDEDTIFGYKIEHNYKNLFCINQRSSFLLVLFKVGKSV